MVEITPEQGRICYNMHKKNSVGFEKEKGHS